MGRPFVLRGTRCIEKAFQPHHAKKACKAEAKVYLAVNAACGGDHQGGFRLLRKNAGKRITEYEVETVLDGDLCNL